MFKILDWYVGRTLLSTTFITLFVLIGLSSLISFVDQLRRVGQGDYDMVVAGIYVLMSIPREVEQFFPMATLIGGLVGMGILASNSELVVMQSAGQSRWNIILSAMKSAILMVIFVMALGEWVTPVAESRAKEIRTQAISGGRLYSSGKLDWAKDGQNFVSIGEVISSSQLLDITIYEFDDSLQLRKITTADSGRFVQDKWQLSNVNNTYLSDEQVLVQNSDNENWLSSLTPDKLSVVTVKPEALSIQGLAEYILYLENSRQDPSRYRLALWRKILQPVSVTVMLLMALSFIFGPLRSVTMGARVIMGVLTGFGFFIANEVFGPLSLVYNLPPVVGALLPSVLFAAISTYLLRK
ncbi:lipopolysaccharide ABC transporter permease LptG [Alteromonadaceae bacterium M269]|nr:lipopolysaccharide ABC transporter permease LptG [Alteromonadaceae bacterium M269]